jgi:predicted esterase
MNAHRITAARSARYFTLGAPSPAVREVWLVLHGYGQLAERFVRHFRPIDDGTRLIVAPEALSRFYVAGSDGHVGASWMTREDRVAEIEDYIAYLDAVVVRALEAIDRERIRLVVLGFSQGGATAARWAARGAHRAEVVALWGSRIPDEIDLSSERFALVFLVDGTRDEYRRDDAIERDRIRLSEAAIPTVSIEYDGTHRIESGPLIRLASSIGMR